LDYASTRSRLSFLEPLAKTRKMNGVNGTGPSPGLWQEARTPEGKLYYYHSQTKATSWTKPVESTAEVRLDYLQRSIVANCGSSELLQLSHGKKPRRLMEGSTGTMPTPRRQHGTCQRFTRMSLTLENLRRHRESFPPVF